MIGIYRIRNLINDKCYYGSAKKIKRRWTRHKSQLKYDRHENIILQRAWNKYGEENFVFEIIEECDEKNILVVEQKYLDLKPKYNIGEQASGGDNMKNHPNRDNIIKKRKTKIRGMINEMSDAEKKKIWSRPNEMNGRWKGDKKVKYCKCGKEINPISTTCSRCRDRTGKNNSFYGKNHTTETIKHLSESRIGKYSGNQNIQFEIDGVEYFSLGDASGKLNIPIATIRWRLKSKNLKFLNYKYI